MGGSCRQKKRIKDKDACFVACMCCNTNIRVRFKSIGSLGNDSQIHAFSAGRLQRKQTVRLFLLVPSLEGPVESSSVRPVNPFVATSLVKSSFSTC